MKSFVSLEIPQQLTLQRIVLSHFSYVLIQKTNTFYSIVRVFQNAAGSTIMCVFEGKEEIGK